MSSSNPFHPSTLDQGLSGWILILKDLYKRAIMAIEESELVLSALEDLKVLPPRRIGRGSNPKEDAIKDQYCVELRHSLRQLTAKLRSVRDKIQNDLVAIQLTLLDEVSYGDLNINIDRIDGASIAPDIPNAKLSRSRINTRRMVPARPSNGNTTEEQYANALRVLSATSVSVGISVMAKTMNYKTENVSAEEVELIKLGNYIQDKLEERYEDDIANVIIELQNEPMCQPTFIETHFRRSKSSPTRDVLSTEFDGAIRSWLLQYGDSEAQDQIRSLISKSPAAVSTLIGLSEESTRGMRLRAALIRRIVLIGERCWKRRRAEILDRVARYTTGNIPEELGPSLNKIHQDLFYRIQGYYIDFSEHLKTLRSLVHAARQRVTLYPERFFSRPRHHRRGYEAVASILLGLVDRQRKQAEAAVQCLVKGVPRLRVDVSFEYAFSSEVTVFSNVSGSNVVNVVLPFFFLEVPRYFLNLVHEIAHAYISNDLISELLTRDRTQWRANKKERGWDDQGANVIRGVAGQLHRLYATSATGRLRWGEVGIVSEMVADLIALIVGGPHYIFSLLVTTLGHAGLPGSTRGHSDAFDPNATEENPIVRTAVLLRVADEIWGLTSDADMRDNHVACWRNSRLDIVRSIVAAYFNFLDVHARDNVSEKRRVNLFKQEVDILSQAMCKLANIVVGKPSLRRFRKISTDDSHNSKQIDISRSVLSKLMNIYRSIWPELQESDEPQLQKDGWAKGYLVCVPKRDRNLPEDESLARQQFIEDNLIHLLWNSTLKRYREEAVGFFEANDLLPVEERKRARRLKVERALWIRAPEVRPMLELMSYAGQEEEGASGFAPPGERADVEPNGAGAFSDGSLAGLIKGDIVTVLEADAFWWSPSVAPSESQAHTSGWPGSDALEDYDSWCNLDAWGSDEQAWWVLGDHDYHLIRRRFAGPEDLDRELRPARSRLPRRPHFCDVRSVDYEVWQDHGHATAAERLHAFIRLQTERELAGDSLYQLVEDTQDLELAGPLLRSFGWDDYALLVQLNRLDALKRLCIRLEQDPAISLSHHTVNLLWRPPELPVREDPTDGQDRSKSHPSPLEKAPADSREDALVRSGAHYFAASIEALPAASAASPPSGVGFLLEMRCTGCVATEERLGQARDALNARMSFNCARNPAEESLLRGLWRASRPSLSLGTGFDTIELRVAPVFPDRADGICAAMRVYEALGRTLGRAVRAYDFRTRFLLPNELEEGAARATKGWPL